MRIGIVGAGITGLYAAFRLQEYGYQVDVFEARDRIGGRVDVAWYERQQKKYPFDLGPTWYWPTSEPLIDELLQKFDIPTFPQATEGTMRLERRPGQIEEHRLEATTIPARRLASGMRQLAEALASKLTPGKLHLGRQVVRLQSDEQILVVEGVGQIRFDHVLLALPPRLAARLEWHSPLTSTAQQALLQTPTWMANQAKCIVVYDHPFWRAAGRSGFAISWSGILQEVHDASPLTGPGALFGFFRMPADERHQLSEELIKGRVLDQLTDLFGDEARMPLAWFYRDWTKEQWTATMADKALLTDFPVYRPLSLGPSWDEWVTVLGTETDSDHGGHLEGALRSVERFMHKIDEAK